MPRSINRHPKRNKKAKVARLRWKLNNEEEIRCTERYSNAEDTSRDMLTQRDSWRDGPKPRDTSWDMLTPRDSSGDIPTPRDTSRDMPTSRDTSGDMPTPSDTSWDMLTPRDSSRDIPTPRDTSRDMPTSRDTSGDMPTPRDTSWDMLTPRDLSRNTPTPRDTSWDMPTPRDIANSATEHSLNAKQESDWEADNFMKNPGWCDKKYRKDIQIEQLPGVITLDEYERIQAHQLTVEVEPKEESIIKGNRIVELGYILNWAITLQYDHSKICTTGKLSVKEEIRRGQGLISTVGFKCNLCSREYYFDTEDPNKQESVINTGAVWGTLATGSTYSHMSEFLGCMDVPTMPVNMFYNIENDLGKVWESAFLKSMETAGQKEKEMALENDQVCSDGIPWITVYVDGSWSKRSYGTNFNALSGMVAIIGKYTEHILFIGVRNKFCSICARAENLGLTPKKHICYKNWDRSAPAMEADMVVEGFNCSETMHGVRYLKFIGDGDSSVYAKILENVSYGRDVKKVECTNHALKNYGKRLRSIKADTQISLKGRKLLTLAKIKLLTKRAKCSIYEHAKKASRNVDILRKDLRNGLHHVFGDHTICRQEICNTVGDITNNQIPDLKSTTIYNHLYGSLDLLVRKAHLLIENENNNRAERLMNIVSRFNQGKRLNLIQRGSYQRRVHLAGLRYNETANWHSTSYKGVVGCSPGKYFKEFMQKNANRQKSKACKRLFSSDEDGHQQKKRRISHEINRDYGPNAEEPEPNEERIQQEVDDVLNMLQVSEEERNRIQVESVGQFGNQVFECERKNRLTASMFGRVIKRLPHTSCHNLVKACLKNNTFWSEATEYGILKEKVAVGLFEKKMHMKVVDSGFWIDLVNGYLGASPDGLIGNDALIEVKCLYSATKLDSKPSNISDIIDKMKSRVCLEKYNNGIRLKRNHSYYYQVQGQLNITMKEKCYFVVYVDENIDLFIEEIERDVTFWNEKMLPKLSRFYKECIAPELVRNNLGKGKRCVDPPYIKIAIQEYELRKAKGIERKN